MTNIVNVNTSLIKDIKKVCIKFLKEQGGMGNGYSTKIDGQLCYNISGGLSVMTPRFQYKTLAQISHISCELEGEIKAILREHKCEQTIKFDSIYKGDGCFEIEIIIEYRESISFL